VQRFHDSADKLFSQFKTQGAMQT
jgi:hypothetical protein